VVRLVECCCLLFNLPESWEEGKKHLLGDIKFLQKMVDYDVTKKKNSRFKLLRKKYLSDPNFNFENIRQQSESSATIFNWITAID